MRITAEQYTLLHIVGHGKYTPGGETILVLATADDQVDPVAATRLLDRFGKLQGARGLPHFAFLSTCESAVPEAEGALGGLAQRLVRDLGMPAVLAMTEKVSVATAQALAEVFYVRLREHGEVDRALVEALAGLAGRHDVNVPALYSRLGGRPLFSDALNRPLTSTEITYGLARAKDLLTRRGPVLLDEFNQDAAKLSAALEADLSHMSPAAREEREQALAAIGKMCEEALDLGFPALALGQEPPPYDERCPFRGLYPFQVEDREFFFGRESLIARLKARLAEHSFLAVLGPSGSGKSSLVLAGLIPALQAKEPHVKMAYLTPGSDPLDFLEVSLQINPRCSCLVVDQFEELFTLCTDEAKRRAFLDRLLQLPEQMRVILTMRADFWGECAPYRELKELMQARQELIAPMDAAELRRAMEMQAAKVGLRFEADLSNTLLDDVRGEPGAMPLLQHALLQLWHRRHGRWLRAQEYRALGGVKEAIAATAEGVHGDLSEPDREQVRQIFLRLTRIDEEPVNPQERRDTRQRVALEELTPRGGDPALTKRLIKRLADARLLVTNVNATTKLEEVEVAHEALIRHWPRLRQWLDENRTDLRLLATVRTAAVEWTKDPGDETLLVHRGLRLVEAEQLKTHARLGLNRREADYVDACVAFREREQRDREERARRELEQARALAESQLRRVRVFRSAAIVSSVLLAAAVLSGLVAYFYYRTAQRSLVEKGIALDKEKEAVAASERLAANVAFDRGQSLCQSGDIGSGMLWLAHSLRLTPKDDEERQWVIRASLAGWRRQLWPLKAVFVHGGRDSAVAISPDGKTALTGNSTPEAQLWNLTTGTELGKLVGHEKPVLCVAFSPGGKKALTGSEDGSVRLWDVATRAQLRQLPGSASVWAVAFSPDGSTALTGSADRFARLWDLSTCREVRKLEGHSGPVQAVAFNSEGTAALTGALDGARLWQLPSGKPVRAFQGNSPISSVAFGQRNRLIATGSEQGPAQLWNPETGEPVGLPLGHGNRRVMAAVFSPDGKSVLTGSSDRFLRFWELPGENQKGSRSTYLTRLLANPQEARALAYSSDGTSLLAGSTEQECRCWGVPRNPGSSLSLPHPAAVVAATYSPDARTILTRIDRAAYRWDADTGQALPFAPPALNSANAQVMAFSPDGEVALVETAFRQSQLWSVTAGKAIGDTMSHPGRVGTVLFSPDGKTVFTVSDGKMAQLWAADTGKLLANLPHQERINAAVYRSDGKVVVTASNDKKARAWEVPGGALVNELVHEDEVLTVALTHDGQVVGTGSKDKTGRLWATTTGKQIGKPLYHNGYVSALAFSPDGKTVLTGSSDGTARLWVTATGQPLSDVFEHRTAVSVVDFSHDNQLALTGCEDGTVRLWHVRTGKAVGPPFQHEGEVLSVAFAPDGRHALTGSENKYAQVWDIPIPLAGDAEAILHWMELAAGMELDATGTVRFFSAREWQERRKTVRSY
jgi:WD40 repeat protein